MAIKQTLSKVKANFMKEQDRGAQRTVLDELFNDYYRARKDVYKMNFIRGIFFGFGTALGGSVILALVIYVVSLVARAVFGEGWLDGVRDTIQQG